MKTKKFKNKLKLKKSTIANLGDPEKSAAKGGYLPTKIEATCYTWCDECLTKQSCDPTCYYSCYCVTISCGVCE